MGDIKLTTKYAELIRFSLVNGGAKGMLHIAEAEKHIPFEIRRTYVMSGVDSKESRGGHAHKTFDQVIVPIRGSFVLVLDDGENKQEVSLRDPSVGVRLKPKLWHSMRGFSHDAVVMVFANAHYDAKDYIHDYDEFLAYVKTNPDE